MIRTVSVITTLGALRRIFPQRGDRDISKMNIRGTIQTRSSGKYIGSNNGEILGCLNLEGISGPIQLLNTILQIRNLT